MTRPVNLYLLSRIREREAFNHVYHHAAEKKSSTLTALHEMASLRSLADLLISEGVSVSGMDGFFFSYSIPQIGKEFDLLKFREDACLNIELKSQPVPLEQIRSQLVKNRHYLSHLGKDTYLFTYVSDTRQCFTLTESSVLAPVTPADIAKAVLPFADGCLQEIDGLFQPSEYIVSPSGTPQKFLDGEYFLTQAQDQVRKGLLSALDEVSGQAFFSLVGKPGTGKTLLLYDVGRALAAHARTALLSWGKLSDGHRMINDADIGLTILPWGELAVDDGDKDAAAGPAATDSVRAAAALTDDGPASPAAALPDLATFSYVLVDESHRLTPAQFDAICEEAKRHLLCVVFCLDPEQVLTTAERHNNIAGRVDALPPAAAFTLSERLRGNRELASFIQQVRDLKNKPSVHLDYRDVDLAFAASVEEARNQLTYFRDQGYVFINYLKTVRAGVAADSGGADGTDSGGAADSGGATGTDTRGAADSGGAADSDPAAVAENPFTEFEGGYDIHHVIGQEFDRVVMLLDNSFRYSEEGRLEGVPKPNPDFLYPNLFYQSITRVQEKLALIVLENEPLFDKIAGILEQ